MALNQVLTGPQRVGDGATITARGGKDGEALLSQMNPRYYENVYRGRVFSATAIGIAANVIYSTAAGTGGPLIWNPPGSGVNVVLLKVAFQVTTASTVVGMAGIATGTGQLLAPTTTTALTVAVYNTLIGAGAASQVNAYNIGTVVAAGTRFTGLFAVNTQAVTVPQFSMAVVDLEGSFIAPPGTTLSCSSGSATLTTAVSTCSAMWAEIPI